MTDINVPLKYLKKEWKFREIKKKTELDFSIDFELKNNFNKGFSVYSEFSKKELLNKNKNISDNKINIKKSDSL